MYICEVSFITKQKTIMVRHYKNTKNGEVKILSPEIIKISGDEEFWKELSKEEVEALKSQTEAEQSSEPQVQETPIANTEVGGGKSETYKPADALKESITAQVGGGAKGAKSAKGNAPKEAEQLQSTGGQTPPQSVEAEESINDAPSIEATELDKV